MGVGTAELASAPSRRLASAARLCRLGAALWTFGPPRAPAGCKTANGGHMVEAAQDIIADFMLHKADASKG